MLVSITGTVVFHKKVLILAVVGAAEAAYVDAGAEEVVFAWAAVFARKSVVGALGDLVCRAAVLTGTIAVVMVANAVVACAVAVTLTVELPDAALVVRVVEVLVLTVGEVVVVARAMLVAGAVVVAVAVVVNMVILVTIAVVFIGAVVVARAVVVTISILVTSALVVV